jgi:DNA modification methylase
MIQQSLDTFFQSEEDVSKQDVKNANEQNLIHRIINGDIPLGIEDNAYLNIFRDSDRDVHNIALYPCKFIPELPRWAIKNYSNENDIVLDPFIGGGTTFVESLKLRRNCLGIDYNPYARLISKVKSTPLDMQKVFSEHRSLIYNIKKNNEKTLPKPTFKGVEFWFNENVISGLLRIKKEIYKIQDEDIRDFFLVAFSMAVRKTSYIAPGQILTARRKDWKDMKHYSESETIEVFSSYCEEYIDYLKKFPDLVNEENYTKIIGNDARNINLPEDIHEVDIIVSSPPYINSMDYIWANRLRLHWLDLVKNDNDRLNLYNQEIGTERIPKKEYSKIGKLGFDDIDKTIEDIYHSYDSTMQSQLRSRVTYKYFLDMKIHFEEAYKKLKDSGYYCIVIGDNNIRKVTVPTSNYLTTIAESVGFVKEKQFQILLKNRSLNIERNLDFADKIDYDRMIVLRKN